MSLVRTLPALACLACLAWLPACSSPPESHQPALLTNTGTCSDLKRVWAWSQGRSAQACGNVEFRSAIPLGDGYVVFVTPSNGYADLWRLQPDEHFGAGPLSAFPHDSSSLSRSLTALDGELAFEYNQATSKARVLGVLPSARGETPALFNLDPAKPWPRALGGRSFVSLGDDALLDFEPGSGSYSVVRYESGRADAFERTDNVGQREAFRRGHSWLRIGAGYLLEWSPSSHEFHVWGYDLSRLPGDVLDAEPRAAGAWPELGGQHELLPLSDTRIAIWDRALGTLDVRELRAKAADPVGSRVLGLSRDDRFRSLTRPFSPPTQSQVRHLVIVFTQGPSFDAYFGRYCGAPSGSAPRCETGPSCCEAAPESLAGSTPASLADLDESFRPDDSRECVLQKQLAWQQGALPATCGDTRDFSCLTENQGEPPPLYHQLADRGLLADRYYAAVADSWQTNFLFFATGAYTPAIAAAGNTSIATLFGPPQVPFATYVPDITYLLGQAAPSFVDPEWAHFRAVAELDHDVASGQLAPISVIIAPPGEDESRDLPGSLEKGAQFVSNVVDIVTRSSQGKETLLLVAPLTGSGFYDHLSPPAIVPSCDVSGVARGLRVPLLAFGPFIDPGRISHTELDHASLTAFIEWNWLGEAGQLGGRDACAGDLRALLTDAALVPAD
ncbi:MAG TPA: alkaline phosphatase family protein [Polyangiaceae bacterium]|nr:alkaline phosphatase family protein [Polyangiaceae bacterium]